MLQEPTLPAPGGATETRAPRRALFARLGPYASAAVGMFTIALIWLGVYYNVSRDYRQDELAAKQTTGNLARAFEEQIIRSIRAVDQTLLYARASYKRSNGTFDLFSWSRHSQFLADLAFQISIVDRNGILIASSIGTSERVDLGDREHFIVHKLREADELFISQPVLGRVSKKWSIQFTRRISNEDGSFGGIVVVSVDPAYLSDFYESIDIGERGAVTLVGTDGIIRARWASGIQGIGVDINGGELMRRFGRATGGFYSGRSSVDGTARLNYYRQVKGYPLIIAVGLADDEVFASSVQSRNNYLTAAILLTALLALVNILVIRYQHGLALARDAAEAATKARSEFLAVMSHEIRTPMNAVLGFASTLLESKLDTEQRLNATALHAAGDDLLRLLNDILDFSRLDAGRIPFEDIAFSPAGVVETTVSIARRSAAAKGLSLRVEIDPDLPPALRGDAGRLRQVLLNLLTNAIKFTNRGEILVAARWLGGNARNATVQWSVTDSGIGIAPDRVGGMFTDFVQADSSVNRRFGGSGLGLAICKRIVDQMGGRIGATSIVGQGSTFTFSVTLPIGELVIEAETSPDSAVLDLKARIAALGRPLRILLAEDNPTNQLVGKQMLREFDANVSVASNGAEAVQSAGDFPYDVILMDMQMPEMNGIEATHAIRARADAHAQVPIVALTANAYPEDVKACLDAGMNGFVSKPVRKSALAEAILRSLGGMPRTEAPAPADRAASNAGDAEPALLDTTAVDEFVEDVGNAAIGQLLGIFLGETERRLGLLRSLTVDNPAEIHLEAHTLKGSSGLFGLLRFSALARELERSANTITAEEFAAALDRLEQVFAESRNALLDYAQTFKSNDALAAE